MLEQLALEGQPFIYVKQEDIHLFGVGDSVMIDQGLIFEEITKVKEVYSKTGALRLEYGLRYMHGVGAMATVTADVEYEMVRQDASLDMVRITVPLALDAKRSDTSLHLGEGCHHFSAGDEVELTGKEDGRFEFNVVLLTDYEGAGNICGLQLLYPIASNLDAGAELSKFVLKDSLPQGTLEPTPAPTATATKSPTPAPTVAITMSPTSVPTTAYTKGPTPAPTAVLTKSPTPEPTAAAAKGLAKDLSSLDADKDGRITKKEAWVGDPEVFARFDDLDKNDDSLLERGEYEGYETLDADGDGSVSESEAATDTHSKQNFRVWDQDDDGKLSALDLEAAGLGQPQIAFEVKGVNYESFSADRELFESKLREVEQSIARTMEVDDNAVLVKFFAGSLRVDAYILCDEGEAKQKSALVKSTVDGLLLDDPAMQPHTSGTIGDKAVRTASAPEKGSEAPWSSSSKWPRFVLIGTVCAICVGVLGIVTYGTHPKAAAEVPTPKRSKWIDSPPDAIIVLGGGLNKDGTLTPWIRERLKRAKFIYDEIDQLKRDLETKAEGTENSYSVNKVNDVNSDTFDRASSSRPPYIVTMCEGIRYSSRDPRGNRSLRLESQLAAEWLKAHGVRSDDVITDDLSLDTIGNAYFLRTTSHDGVCRARSLVVITNEFHMPRAKAIIGKLYQLGPFADNNVTYDIKFESVTNKSIDPASLKLRCDWEAEQLAEFEQVSHTFGNLYEVHSYIFRDARSMPESTVARQTLPTSFAYEHDEQQQQQPPPLKQQ